MSAAQGSGTAGFRVWKMLGGSLLGEEAKSFEGKEKNIILRAAVTPCDVILCFGAYQTCCSHWIKGTCSSREDVSVWLLHDVR